MLPWKLILSVVQQVVSCHGLHLQIINSIIIENDAYIPKPYVVISAGMTMASFDILIEDDNILEGDEYFYLNIILCYLPKGIMVTNHQARVTIVDNERKQFSSLSMWAYQCCK